MVLGRITFDAGPILKDPRWAVITAQFAYLIFGVGKGFDVSWLQIATALVSALAAEMVFSKLRRGIFTVSLSDFATAFGIGMYFRSTSLELFALASLIAIGSKFFIRKQSGHIFNPSNLGIVLVALLIPNMATIEFTQWGSSLGTYVIITAICLLVAYHARVIDLSLSFLGSYLALLWILLPHIPEIVSPHYYGIIGPSLVVFSTLMITDPKTIPVGRIRRLVHGFVVIVFFFMYEQLGVRYSLFIALPTAALFNLTTEYLMARSRADFPYKLEAVRAMAAGAIACIAFAPAFASQPAFFSRSAISLDFILRGIESGGIVSAPKDPAFIHAEDSLFGDGTYTYGAAWGDFNSDSYDDLFVSRVGGDYSRLYKNDGRGGFIDITEQVGLPYTYSSSGYFADYDNDGLLDLFIVLPGTERVGPGGPYDLAPLQPAIRVFRNTGKLFREVTAQVGLTGFGLETSQGAGLSFADFNNDGQLDFIVANSGVMVPMRSVARPGTMAMQKSRADSFYPASMNLICDRTAVGSYISAHPLVVEGTPQEVVEGWIEAGGCIVLQRSLPIFPLLTAANDALNADPVSALILIPGSMHLFKNTGDGFVEKKDFSKTIEDIRSKTSGEGMVFGQSGVNFVSGRYFQPVSFDYNGDGLQDCIVSADMGAWILLKNNGGFEFSAATQQSGLDRGGTSMGVSLHYDNQSPIVATTNALEDYLFKKNPDNSFSPLPDISKLGFGWGISFLDYDMDGIDDIYIANGDQTFILYFQNDMTTRPFYREDKLYRGHADGTYSDESWRALDPDISSGKTLAQSDYDNNGTPDLYVGNLALGRDRHDFLLQNAKRGAHYIKVSLRGSQSNSFGVGATVTVISGASTQTKAVAIGSSFYSEDSLRLTFALQGDAPAEVKVKWPSGKVTKMNAPADREITIYE